MRSKGLWGAVALVVVGIIFGAVLVSGFGLVRPSMASIQLGSSYPPVNLNADATSFSQAFIAVAKNVTPQIVKITVVSKVNNPHQDFFFFPFQNMPKEEEGSGSGIIISPDGYILTNNHVVQNATKVRVDLMDKRTFTAKVIGTDPQTDIAVIKINATDLPTAYLGNSDSLKVGQWVMAIGNPLSTLTSTVTAGIIGALGRGRLGLIDNGGGYGIEDYIQTDAPINPGNSGGALVDLSGAVIGINAAIATRGTDSFIGYGFAIPINLAKTVAKQLMAYGKVKRGYIGVQIGDVDNAIAKSIGLDKPTGAIIQSIVPGGAASKEDIKPGDVILKIDGEPVSSANDLQEIVATKSAGSTLTLTLYRNGKEIERKVTLKEQSENKSEPVSNENNSNNKSSPESSVVNMDKIGLSVRNLSSKEKSDYKVDHGIIITDVKQYSEAQNKGLMPNIVITEADSKPVDNVKEFQKVIEDKKGAAVLLRVRDSKGTSMFVGLDIPE